jgi:hypothetical protein
MPDNGRSNNQNSAVFVLLKLLHFLTILTVQTNIYIYIYYCLKVDLLLYYHCQSKKENEFSNWLSECLGKLGPRNSERLNSVKHMLKGRLPLNFIPMKCEQLLAQRNVETDFYLMELWLYIYCLFWSPFPLICRIYVNLSLPLRTGTKITTMVKSMRVDGLAL